MKKLLLLISAILLATTLSAQDKWTASKAWSNNLPQSYKDTLKSMTTQDVYFFCRDKFMKADSVCKVFNQTENDFSQITASTPKKYRNHDYLNKDSTLSYLLEQVKTAISLQQSLVPCPFDSLEYFWKSKLCNYDVRKGSSDKFLSDADLFCMYADLDIQGMEITIKATRQFCDYAIKLSQGDGENDDTNNEGWEVTHHEGDELTGYKAYDSYMYNDADGNSFVYWSDSHDSFRIITNDGIFNYETFVFGAAKPHYYVKNIKVGYYDENGKLVDSNTTSMTIREGKPDQAGTPGLKTGRKVIKYIEQSKGYVRIVAPIYGSNVPFDIKVPCRSE